MITLDRITEEEFYIDAFNIINNNFAAIQDSIGAITDIIDISQKKIRGIESLDITKEGLGNITDVLFTTNGSGTFGGNILVRQIAEVGSLVAQTNITSETGILNVKNVESLSTIQGSLRVDREFVLGSARNAPVAMQFTNTTKQLGLIGFPTYTVGKIDARGNSFMILDFSGRNVSNVNDFLNNVRLDNTGVKIGQTLDVFVLLPQTPIGLDTYKIVNGQTLAESAPSIVNLPVNAAIEFTDNWQGASFIFSGSSWILKALYNGAIKQFVNN
jgi:hypothetical protein